MKIILLILFFISKSVFSQDLEKIEKADTVYIYFKEDKIKQIHHRETRRSNNKKYDTYFFDYGNEQIAFEFTNFKTPDNIKKVKKKFLKKNKDLILNYDFIKKNGNLRIAEMIGVGFNFKKIVYVIEDNEIGCFTIKLKEVGIVGPIRFSIE